MPKSNHTTKYNKRGSRSKAISYLVHVDPSPDGDIYKHTASNSYLASRISAANKEAKQRAFGRFEGTAGIGILRVNDVRMMMDLQGWACIYCKTKISFHTCDIDHVYPIAKGGEHYLYNVILSCHTCNMVKSARTLRRFCNRMGYDFEAIAQEIAEIYCAIHKELYDDTEDVPEVRVD